MTLRFITGNRHKFDEMRKELPGLEQLSIDLPEVQSLDPREVVRAKLITARGHHDGDFLVEDVSLHMGALNGLPGPFIKFFLEVLGREGLAELAERMDDASVTATCTIGLLEDGEIFFFQGDVRGDIVPPQGTSGFGWDPIFCPEGHERTFAEMTAEEKNAISHRGKAVARLKGHLER